MRSGLRRKMKSGGGGGRYNGEGKDERQIGLSRGQ
jgi:hypothetical protein